MDNENNNDKKIESRGIIGDLKVEQEQINQEEKELKKDIPLEKIDGINPIKNEKDIFGVLKKYKKIYFIILIIMLATALVILGLNLLNILNGPKGPKGPTEEEEMEKLINIDDPEDSLVKRKIDGVAVKNGEENLFPYSVVVENSIDARPLSGINEANVVYEALVEGNITRFLFVYANKDEIKKIGPIRSARPYLLELADEYSPLFVHFGGSPEALNNINKGAYNITSLNGIVHDQVYFYRDVNLKAPHNAYISTELISKYLEKIENTENNGYYTSWIFNDTLKEYKGAVVSRKFDVIYSKENTLYNVFWKYNEETKDYTRYDRDDKTYLDDANNLVKTNNIIIQYASTSILDKQLRKKIDLTEGGKAIMIRDGNYVEGFWRKNNILNRTKFFSYDKDGNEVEYELKPGKIWIHILPKE